MGGRRRDAPVARKHAARTDQVGKLKAVAPRTAVRQLVLPFCLAILPTRLPAQLKVHLSAETGRAFDEYVKAAESEMDGRPRFETSGTAVSIAAGGPQSSIDVKDGIVHDWDAAAL